jgi:hypothetical protein
MPCETLRISICWFGDVVVDRLDARDQQEAAFADHAVLPPRDLAGRVLRRFEALERLRAEHAVGDVLLARPHELHRTADRLGDRRALGGIVAERTPAEAAAHVALVHGHVRGLEPERLRHLVARGIGRLAAFPDFRLVAGRADADPRRSAAPSARDSRSRCGTRAWNFLAALAKAAFTSPFCRAIVLCAFGIVVDLDVAFERLDGVEAAALAFAHFTLSASRPALARSKRRRRRRGRSAACTMPMTPFIALTSASFQLSGGAASAVGSMFSQTLAPASCTGECSDWRTPCRQLHVDGVCAVPLTLDGVSRRGTTCRSGGSPCAP